MALSNLSGAISNHWRSDVASDLRKPSARPQERPPRPRGAHAAARSVRFRAPSPAVAGPYPALAAVAALRLASVRVAAAGLCAAAVVAVVVPLAILQIPDAIAWSLSP